VTKKTATKKATTKRPAKPEPVSFNKDYRPGKGVALSTEALEQLFSLSDTIGDIYLDGERSEKDMESMLKRAFGDPIEVDLKWGKKWLARCFESRRDNEIRISIVLRDGKLKVDVREWYNPDK
jgi:hypothetical protein